MGRQLLFRLARDLPRHFHLLLQEVDLAVVCQHPRHVDLGDFGEVVVEAVLLRHSFLERVRLPQLIVVRDELHLLLLILKLNVLLGLRPPEL